MQFKAWKQTLALALVVLATPALLGAEVPEPGGSGPGIESEPTEQGGGSEPGEEGLNDGTESQDDPHGQSEDPPGGETETEGEQEPRDPPETPTPTAIPPEGEDADTGDQSEQEELDRDEESAHQPAEVLDPIEVSGTIVQVAGEPLETSNPESQTDDRTLLASDEGPVIPIDVVGGEEGEEVGNRVEARVEFSEAIEDVILESQNDNSGPDSRDDAAAEEPLNLEDESKRLEIAAAAAEEVGEDLDVVLESSVPEVAASAASRSHTVDLVYFHSGAPASKDKRLQIEQLVRNASSYWKGQSESKIPYISLSQSMKSRGDFAGSWSTRCSSNSLWELWSRGASAFGRSSSDYLSGSSTPRHLIVVVDDQCGGYGNTPGWGTVGALHSGGMSWINIGTRGRGPISKMTGTVAHELGHNLGLGHGNARTCSGSRSDAKMVRGKVSHPCRDTVYGDPYSVMGQGNWIGGTRPPALPISARYELGVLDTGDVRTVRREHGIKQTHYVSAAGHFNGRRGLRIVDPRVGTFFVELRGMSGQDSSMGMGSGSVWREGRSGHYYQAPGVRVTRTHQSAGIATTVMSINDSVRGYRGKFQTLRPGKSVELYPGNVRITVSSLSHTGARVVVEFRTFNDAPFGHPFESSMAWMKESGIFTGSRFTPEHAVTRQIAAVYLYRAQGRPAYTPPSQSYFRDVPTSHPYYKEIMWLRDEGIFRGSDPNGWRPLFKPNSPLTRAAMAAFMKRASHENYTAPSTPYFRDVGRSYFVYEEIWWMRSRGLFKGPNYWPNQHIDKQVFAVFLHRWKT